MPNEETELITPTDSNWVDIERSENRRIRLKRQLKDTPVSIRNSKKPIVLPALRDFQNKAVAEIPSRVKQGLVTWRVMVDVGVQSGLEMEDAKKQGAPDFSKVKAFRERVQVENDLLGGLWGHHGIVYPEYDLLEPFTILDTETYYKQALERKLALMFRNGYEITGENNTWVNYVTKRLSQMGYLMNNPFENFLKEILWNLLVVSNCVLIKLRDKDCSGGSSNDKNGNKTPIAGYILCPPHTIFPYMDGQGHISKWRRMFGNGKPFVDYEPDDIVHFYIKRKPGHIWGTPDVWAAKDDIWALRRLEENVELLMNQHMFPLMHLKVGTENNPCEYFPDGRSEIDVYRNMLQSMPKEGVLVTDERVEVSVEGVGDKGANYEFILRHYKGRTFTGMGVSAVDMGETDTSNKSTADSVSQNLKDDIKAFLGWCCKQFGMFILKDLFMEAPFQLSVQNAVQDVSLEFHEIDLDSKIKTETHAANQYNNNAITHSELRQSIKKKSIVDDPDAQKDLHQGREVVSMAKMEHSQNKEMANLSHQHALEQAAASGSGPTKKTTVKHSKSASGGSSRTKIVEEPTKTPGAKVTATKVQPENQHGKNLDPHKAKSSAENLVRYLVTDFMDIHQELSEANTLSLKSWDDSITNDLESIVSVSSIEDETPEPVQNIDKLKSFIKDAVRLSYSIDPEETRTTLEYILPVVISNHLAKIAA